MTTLASRPATPNSAGGHIATGSLVNGHDRSYSSPCLAPPTSTAPPISLEEVRKWNDADVAAWLASHRLSHHALTFSNNDITGQVLLDVDQNALREMGIVAVGDRIRVFSAIKALKKRCIESAQISRHALLLAQERADAAFQAQLYAEQLKEDERLMDQLSRPHEITFLQDHPNGEVEYMNGACADDGSGVYIASLGALDGAAAAAAAAGGLSSSQDSIMSERRSRPSSRPPPLRLSGTASSNIPTTPPFPSPSMQNGFTNSGMQSSGRSSSHNNLSSMGFSQGRGLGPANGTGKGSTDRSGSASRSPLPTNFRSIDSRTANGTSTGSSGPLSHRKTNSALPATFSNQTEQAESPLAPRQYGSLGVQTQSGLAGRPSTSSTYPSASGMDSSAMISPTSSTFANRLARPATADPAAPLTPITESNMHSPTTPTSSNIAMASSLRQGATSRSAVNPAYRYNNYQAPSTPSSAAPSSTLRGGTPGYSSYEGGPHPSLEDLKRRTIKFIGDNGTTRIVNVSDCADAHEVLARVLKKFGKSPSANSYPPTRVQSPNGPDVSAESNNGEKYVIVATSGEGATRDLKPEELLAICHAPQPHDPLRERGLVLRKISPGASSLDSTPRRIARSGRNKLEAFFGERMHDGHHSGHQQGAGGVSPALTGTSATFLSDDPSASAGQVTTAGRKMNRASTVSIMTGLGAGALMAMAAAGHGANNSQSSPSGSSSRGGTLSPADPNSGRDGTSRLDALQKVASTSLLPLPRKARNFMGQRPPSELISSHLTDFFPAAEKRVLERTARKSIYGRASTSLRSSKRDSTWSFKAGVGEDTPPPPLPTKSGLDADGRKGMKDLSTLSSPSAANVPTLPSVFSGTSLDDWSRSVQQSVGGTPATRLEIPEAGGPQYALRPRNNRQTSEQSSARASLESSRSRKSHASHIRGARNTGTPLGGFTTSSYRPISTHNDRSDTASMLTVDEITQEVENRRLSQNLNDHATDTGDENGWVVDGDGVPIPVGPAPRRGTSTSSRKRGKRDRNSGKTGDGTSLLTLAGDSIRERRTSEEVDDMSSPSPEREATDSSPAPASVVLERPSPALDTSRAELSPSLQEEDEDEDDESEDGSISESSLLDDYGDSGGGSEDEDEDDEAAAADAIEDVFGNKEGAQGDHFTDRRSSGRSGGGTAASATRASSLQMSMTKKSPSGGPPKQAIKWIKGALIGAGSFGSVYLGMNAKNGLLMAVKQVELPSGQSQNDQKKKRMLDALEGEIELLKTLQHDNIVQYLDSYADGTHLNIFLEYVPGGSVVALLRNYGAFEEPLVRNFVRQILHGLSFLHGQDIVHRDIKGANILVDNKSCIKISDFGISKKVESDLLANARAHRPSLQGSVFWMAPEVVKQTSYSRKADIWSLGCLVVEMMSGTHPWPNLNQMQALFKIGSCAKPSLPEEISREAVDFLGLTFEIDQEKRPTADELLRHAFITEEGMGGMGSEGEAGAGAGAGGVKERRSGSEGQTRPAASSPFPPGSAAAAVQGAGDVQGDHSMMTKRRDRQGSNVGDQ